MSGDAYYPNVSLLLHCDGTDGSTTFTDSSPTPKTVTVAGNAHMETDQSQFGGASGAFDGTGDYLTLGATHLDSGTWCLEFFVRFSALGAGNRTLASQYLNGNAARTIFDVRNTKLSIFSGANGVVSGATTLLVDTWYHVAFVRVGTSCYGYLDGVLEITHTNFQTPYAAVTYLASYNGNTTDYLNGYLDEIRITQGVARYTEAFTPPTAAFPNIAGQIAGVITDDASAPVARVVRAYRRDTGALVGNTTSSAADGTYSMDFLALPGECSVIALDDASGDVYNDLIARVTPA